MSLVLRTNVIRNPISDNVATTNRWLAALCTAAVDTGFLRMTITIASTTTLAQRITGQPLNLYPAVPGVQYRLLAQCRSNVTSLTMRAILIFANGAFSTLALADSGLVAVNDTTFTDLGGTAVAPTGTEWAIPQIGIGGTGPRSNGQTFDVRYVIVEAGSSGPYFDGDSVETANAVYAWTGTAQDSASTERLKVPVELNQGNLTQAAVRASTY